MLVQGGGGGQQQTSVDFYLGTGIVFYTRPKLSKDPDSTARKET